MVTIELQNIRLQGYHGIYEGENKLGSVYEITVRVSYEEGQSVFDNVSETINYAEIYTIVKQRMLVATPLIEKLADDIAGLIKDQYPQSMEIVLSIYKLNAPIQGFEGKVGVTMHKRYDAEKK